RSASKSARTRSTWQGRTSVMRCTAKQAQARNQVSLHAIRAGEGGREFRQLPPFERFAAYRRATTKSGVVQCKISAEPVSVVGQSLPCRAQRLSVIDRKRTRKWATRVHP